MIKIADIIVGVCQVKPNFLTSGTISQVQGMNLEISRFSNIIFIVIKNCQVVQTLCRIRMLIVQYLPIDLVDGRSILDADFTLTPTLQKPEGFRAPDDGISTSLRQDAEGEAVIIYCEPLATRDLGSSDFPASVDSIAKSASSFEFTIGDIQKIVHGLQHLCICNVGVKAGYLCMSIHSVSPITEKW